jgi:hypothetical protein
MVNAFKKKRLDGGAFYDFIWNLRGHLRPSLKYEFTRLGKALKL